MAEDIKNTPDEELYNRLRQQNKVAKPAFDELYRRYSTNIYTYCKKVLNNQPMAEDIFQETFTRFYESAQQKRKMTNVSGYLIKIARNLCLNEKARKYNDNVPLENLQMPHFDNSYGDKQLNELLQTAIDALPKKYREVIVLKEFMDMSYKEIAQALDSTLPIVRIRIYRAKNKLREILAPYLEEIKNLD